MIALEDRIRDGLSRSPAADILTGDSGVVADEAVPAAVLVAITERARPGVLLTVRRDDMRTHAGQVAFPGGRIDPGEDAVDAAVREAWEELELDPARVKPIAPLDDYLTITKFKVTPVAALVPPDLPLRPHDREVADWFEAPLDFLLDPANHRQQTILFRGAERAYYEIAWQERRIWGATAAMLVNLSRRLQWR